MHGGRLQPRTLTRLPPYWLRQWSDLMQSRLHPEPYNKHAYIMLGSVAQLQHKPWANPPMMRVAGPGGMSAMLMRAVKGRVAVRSLPARHTGQHERAVRKEASACWRQAAERMQRPAHSARLRRLHQNGSSPYRAAGMQSNRQQYDQAIVRVGG